MTLTASPFLKNFLIKSLVILVNVIFFNCVINIVNI